MHCELSDRVQLFAVLSHLSVLPLGRSTVPACPAQLDCAGHSGGLARSHHDMKIKKFTVLVLLPSSALLAVWLLGHIWFDQRNKSITNGWSQRAYVTIPAAPRSKRWLTSKLPGSVPSPLGEQVADVLAAYSSEDLTLLSKLQNPEGLEGKLILDTPPYNRLRIAMGISDPLGGQESPGRVSTAWDDLWRQWDPRKRREFETGKMARIVGVDISSFHVRVVTNTFQTSPVDILHSDQHPSFTKFQAPFTYHISHRAAEGGAETRWFDVSMFVKTTRRCYPIAFRLVHFEDVDRWYLAEVTTAFMYGQPMDDYYIL